jgi:accessory gene regulator protein AgrB
VAGGVASLAKLFSVYAVALVLNLPVFVVSTVLSYIAASNFVFGVVAGVIAFCVVRVLTTVVRGEGRRS